MVPSAGSCTAVGSYLAANGRGYGLIVTLSGGTWTATEAPAPANAATFASPTLSSVSCTSPVSCTAVGRYTDTASHDDGLVDTLSAGTWTAAEAPVPANAATLADLSSISCASAGSCTAVGYYTDTASNYDGLIDTLSGGTWTATEAPVPANFPTFASGTLSSVSCASPGSCAAVGNGFIDTLSGGSWTATDAPADLFSISCASAGSCTAVGYRLTKSQHFLPVIDTLSGGTWTAIRAPEPPNNGGGDYGGTGNLHRTGLYSVSCASAGSCTAVGTYRLNFAAPPGYLFYGGLIDTLSGGTWTATEAPLPPNAAFYPEFQYDSLNSVSCTSPVSCTTVGSYTDISHPDGAHSGGRIDTLSGGTWTATEAPEPANGAAASANLIAVSCRSDGACTAVGTYTDTNNTTQGLLDRMTSPPIVAISPASGPPKTAVSLLGGGFTAGETVKVVYKTGMPSPPSVVLCTATTSSNGKFKCMGNIPPKSLGGASGAHKIVAEGSTPLSKATATFTLT